MLSNRLKSMRDQVRARGFQRYRRNDPATRIPRADNELRRQTELFKVRCCEEMPVVFTDERIAFTRTRCNLAVLKPTFLSRLGDGWQYLLRGVFHMVWKLDCQRILPVLHRVQEDEIHNTCPDYSLVLAGGLDARIHIAEMRLDKTVGLNEKEFLHCAIESMKALLELVRRYAAEARRIGNIEIADMLDNVPARRPRSFHEALQTLRVISFAQRLAGMSHCGFGRMDQYLFPFYRDDIESGRVTREGAGELLAEFFISMNRDADLYPGIQQGDNGQSIVLGGCLRDGSSAINDLTYLILEVSCEVRLIDPKINLRIDRNTPAGLLELGSRLTACGLGFPQYSNDEVVIPALVRKGYSLEDARNYAIAACWEFIIPGKGLDDVNQGAVSFPFAVEQALCRTISRKTFSQEMFYENIRNSIAHQIRNILRWNASRIRPSPFLSSLFDSALECGRDITEIATYRNIGIHGAGAANAAEAAAAVMYVFEREGIDGLRKLHKAQRRNFRGYEDLRERLLEDPPKIGRGDDLADSILEKLFDVFADAAEDIEKSCMLEGRRIRPGSGSAMYYIWLADSTKRPRALVEPVVGATSDGRLRDAPFGSSLAPSHETHVDGIMSVFHSFASIDYSRIMNGGPLTIELSHSVFTAPDGTAKLGMLVAYFVAVGGQQLQLNVLDEDELADAIAHPELHRDLIVRVWGWSGYFCELAPEFQRQIIKRHRYGD